MKKVKKRVNLNIELTEINCYGNDCNYLSRQNEFIYRIQTNEQIDLETIEFYVEVEEPETYKEFKKEHNLNSKQLIEWLNKNYK